MRSFIKSIYEDWHSRHLVTQLLRRRIESRFRGSFLGMTWAIILPLMMLAVYTLVFDHFLKVRWPGAEAGGGLETALRIYLGLLVLNFIAENLVSAPQLVIENQQLVKKIVFPLPVLAYVAVFSTLLPFGLGGVIVAILASFLPDTRHELLLLLPVFWFPLLIWALAANWWLGALGVFVRDLGHLMGPFVTLLMFLSPIFYGRAHIPAPWDSLLLLNPLTTPIEAARTLVFERIVPDIDATVISVLMATLLAISGRYVFNRLRPGFADVL